MTLRARTLLIVGMTFVFLVAVLYSASRFVLGREFARIEEQLARDNLQRVLNDLSDEAEALAATASDWAAWDETYAFIQGRGETYLRDNLMPDTFLTLRLSAMAFVESSGDIVYAGGYDLRSRQPSPLAPGFLERLAAGTGLLDLPDVESSTRGILIVGGSAFLVASRPITSSNRDAPILGALVIARHLDEVEIAGIGRQMRLALTVHVTDDPEMDDADRQSYAELAARSGTITRALSEESIAAYGLIRDVDGRSALLVRSVEPRTISREGSKSLLTFLISLMGAGLVVGCVFAAFFSRAVLSPLTQLSRETSRIGTAGIASARVSRRRSDEIGTLADSINGMLEALQRSEDAQDQLRTQLAQAQKMEAIGTLAGGVAHDFNNIMTAIIGYSDYLLARMGPADPFRTEIDEIKKAGERAASLTYQLLAFSRKQILQPRTIDLNGVVSDTAAMLRQLIGEHIHLVTRLAAAPGVVRIDPGQIQQVIMNLTVNARDAMSGGGTLTIETANVTADQSFAGEHPGLNPGEHVLLRVTDSGRGMSEAEIARIFEPFFTTKGLGKGTGLGLAVVFGIVKQSGGCIYASSTVGSGSTFDIFLPKVEEQAAETVEAVPSDRRPAGNETILVAEDDPFVRRFVVTSLGQQGYRILEATDGEQALSMAANLTEKIHLLLTDVVMPVLGGAELAKRLGELRPDLRVLFMSGYPDRMGTEASLPWDGASMLEKPFDAGALARKVRGTLDG
jgi:signal transduction histidine kinase